ncbi:hypothetical protein [Actinocrispum sp. NPDC049592]|uniref:hypothetical protein n=1 Tax=Actinocrispum sp. NPDC049592 TaxID=3154835 RepID=UPI00341B509E
MHDPGQLNKRQDALRTEAGEVLGRLTLIEDIGPGLMTGSYVSRLMTWPELDMMVLVGPDFTPEDVLGLMARLVGLPGVVGLDYADERGLRCPTEHRRDERFHVGVKIEHGATTWSVDLSLWLHDLHTNVTEWHDRLRDTITPEQREAVLWIKDVWHRRPEYPAEVGGLDVYTAVCEGGVRTPAEFAGWLSERGHPGWL